MTNVNQAEARAARREYMRRWRAEHPEAVKAAQVRYWARKAEEMKKATDNQDDREEK